MLGFFGGVSTLFSLDKKKTHLSWVSRLKTSEARATPQGVDRSDLRFVLSYLGRFKHPIWTIESSNESHGPWLSRTLIDRNSQIGDFRKLEVLEFGENERGKYRLWDAETNSADVSGAGHPLCSTSGTPVAFAGASACVFRVTRDKAEEETKQREAFHNASVPKNAKRNMACAASFLSRFKEGTRHFRAAVKA